MTPALRVASVNVNGVRAAFRKGMGEWLAAREVDILALQEVRAATEDLEQLLGGEWEIVHDAATAKGRAGVALATRRTGRAQPSAHRVALGPDRFDSAGRWLEVDYEVGGRSLTVVSAYVHSGEVDTPKQVAKYTFLEGMATRMPQLVAHSELALVVGDLNVGHRELDIRNWRGNRKNAGFLPKERAYFDRFFAPSGKIVTTAEGTRKKGFGWVDVGRAWAGEVDGPYTWWSQRGQAFDTDTGWRLDYHMATPALAATVVDYTIDRATAWDTRWSDHAPVVVDYAI